MFTAGDFLSLTDYFDFRFTDGETFFEVVSKNTSHCWKVVDMGRYYRLYHAHKFEDGYHLHGEYGLMIDCVLDIVEHDEWKLNIWRHKNIGKRKQPKTYFDMLIDTYCRSSVYA